MRAERTSRRPPAASLPADPDDPGAGSRADSATFRAVLDATADGIVVVDEGGRIVFANPAAAEIFGRATDELVGSEFGHPAVAGDVTELQIVHGDSPRTVEMRVTTGYWEGQRAHVAALRDVTEREQARVDLERAVALRDDVISIVGHDFGNPLAVIGGATGAVLEDADHLDRSQRDLLKAARRQVVHLQGLVKSLLTLSRLDAGRLHVDRRRVDVRAVVVDAVEDLVSQGHELAPEVEVADGLQVRADPSHVRQILVNLLTNAVRYGQAPVSVQARRVDEGVDLRVCDQGDGVAEEFLPRLFARFERDANKAAGRKGSGLGLRISRRLAEANGGEVYYRHNEPRGACFGVRLEAASPSRPS